MTIALDWVGCRVGRRVGRWVRHRAVRWVGYRVGHEVQSRHQSGTQLAVRLAVGVGACVRLVPIAKMDFSVIWKFMITRFTKIDF